MFQLDFFRSPEESELAEIRKNHISLKMTLEKVRKGTYAEINSLKKICGEIIARQEIIERNICHK